MLVILTQAIIFPKDNLFFLLSNTKSILKVFGTVHYSILYNLIDIIFFYYF